MAVVALASPAFAQNVIAQGLLYPATDMARAHPSLRDFAESKRLF
ncbi:hypothetical protein [Sphingomonas sp. Leaf257]|nr:hypothetical protein [Sphingomonas sp. Leaf257]